VPRNKDDAFYFLIERAYEGSTASQNDAGQLVLLSLRQLIRMDFVLDGERQSFIAPCKIRVTGVEAVGKFHAPRAGLFKSLA
jgi:hypothetical protein